MTEDASLRIETFQVGIASVGLREEQRQIPTGEPPPLPPNSDLSVIGKPQPRVNGRAKVTGAIRYTVDVAPQGLLYARILRSPYAHAEVRAIDVSAAQRDPRVRAIVRAIKLDDPAQAVVRYVGQPVAAVAATSMTAAEEALRLIRVEILAALLLAPASGLRMKHLKLAQKESFDWPLADVAVVLDLGQDGVCRRASIVLGAAAPTPHRARAAESALLGKAVDDSVAAEAGRAALEGATPLAKNAYKAPMFETLVRRAILQAAAS